MVKQLAGTCRQSGCKIAVGGQCLEGFTELSKCPFFAGYVGEQADGGTVDSLNVTSLEQPITNDAASNGMVLLPGADDLTSETSFEITRAALTRLIVIAGEADSGKTTLLASLTTKFQKGSFAGYMFAGSRTLIGFEKRCHLARVTSGGILPDTERSKPRDDHKQLHLTLYSIKSENITNVIFTDISGETFARARDYAEDCRRLEILRRADRFVLLLDGALLSKPERREEVYRGGSLLLRRCVEEGMLDRYSYVDVLFTKYDLVHRRGLVADTNVFVERVQQRIRERFEIRLGRLCFYKVAARSSDPKLTDINQFANVFSAWVEVSPIYERRYYSSTEHELSPIREFDRFYSRYPSGQ